MMMTLDYSCRGTMMRLAFLSVMLYLAAAKRPTIDHIEQLNGTNDERFVFRVMSRKNVTKGDRMKRLIKLGHGTKAAKNNWEDTKIVVQHIDKKTGKFVVSIGPRGSSDNFKSESTTKTRRVDKIRASKDSETYKGYKLVLKKQTTYGATNVYIKQHPEYPAQCSQFLQLLLNNCNYDRRDKNLQSYKKETLQIDVPNQDGDGEETFDQKIFFNEKGMEDIIQDWQHCAAGNAKERTVFIGFGSFWRVFDALKGADNKCCVSVSKENEKPRTDITIKKLIKEVEKAHSVQIRDDPLQEKVQIIEAVMTLKDDQITDIKKNKAAKKIIAKATTKNNEYLKEFKKNRGQNIPLDIAENEIYRVRKFALHKETTPDQLEERLRTLDLPLELQLRDRKRHLTRFLRSLGPADSSICLIREVKNKDNEDVKPAWAAGLLSYLNKNKKAKEPHYKYVLDFGSKKVNLVDKNGMGVKDNKGEEKFNQEYKQDYDYNKLLSDESSEENVNGEDKAERWNMTKYIEMVKKQLGDARCVARFTGIHRPEPGKKVCKFTAKLMADLAKCKIEHQLLSIEDEAYFGSRHAFSIVQPLFPIANKFKVLEIGSGSNQIGEFTLQEPFRKIRETKVEKMFPTKSIDDLAELRTRPRNISNPLNANRALMLRKHKSSTGAAQRNAGNGKQPLVHVPVPDTFKDNEKVEALLGIDGKAPEWVEATIINMINAGKYELQVEKGGSRTVRLTPDQIRHFIGRRRLASRLENRPIHKLAKLIQQAHA